MGPLCVVRRETLTGHKLHGPGIHTEDMLAVSQQQLMDVHGSLTAYHTTHKSIHMLLHATCVRMCHCLSVCMCVCAGD